MQFVIIIFGLSFWTDGFMISNSDKKCSYMISMARIALTREEGNNNKLQDLLPGHECIELPCIKFGPGSDNILLPSLLISYDIIAISSPQVWVNFCNINNVEFLIGCICIFVCMGRGWST